MNERSASRLPWVALGFVVLLFGVGQAVLVATGSALDLVAVAGLTVPIVGALVASRQPRNAIGWIMLGVGVVFALDAVLGIYSTYGLEIRRGSLPRPAIALVLRQPMWIPVIGLMGTFLILLFPDGRLPSPRWKPWAWLCALAMILSYVASLIVPYSLRDLGYPDIRNPLGIEALRPMTGAVVAFFVLIPIGIVGCAVALIKRFRRSRGQERLQLKWLAGAGGVVAASYLFAMVLSLPSGIAGRPTPHWVDVIGYISVYTFLLIPVAVGIAILKYRLYDIDVVINKTVVFGALAAFITVVYVGVVVGIGTVIGSGDEPNIGLSIVATAIVAVAFQPVRERVQHFANRLVYGKRATPYEVLSEFSDRVAETYAADEVLPKMAKAIKDGTGAERAEVWLRSHDELRPAATWPEDAASRLQPLPLSDGQLPSFAGADKAIEVRHQGELLGALTVTKPQGEPLTPAEDKLLADLASQAGLVLRNVGLTAELLQRLEELKASRQRLVAAQDQERRRLERDLHDGAQQHLVALKTRLSLAKRLTERDANKAAELLSKLEADADEALETLRDLARGIYPPLLADQGLKAALEAHVRKLSIPVEVKAEDISRYPQEIEAAVYFCCLEALQNVAKYANASRVSVRLSERDGELTFVIEDDGQGFNPATTSKGSGTQNMSDRLEALGGHLTVDTARGRGTTVTGRLPAEALEAVA